MGLLIPAAIVGGGLWYLLRGKKKLPPNVLESIDVGNGYVMNIQAPLPGADPTNLTRFEGKTVWVLLSPQKAGVKAGVSPTRAQAIEDAKQAKLQDEIAQAKVT